MHKYNDKKIQLAG